MKILVTGGAGFIASHIVDEYILQGHEVFIVDDLSTGRMQNINPSATFYEFDIRSAEMPELILELKPDVINHHAAQMNARKSVEDPVYDAEVNILAPIKMLEACREIDLKKFIHISSGGTVYGEPVYNPVNESHSINPVCHYGLSKFVLEKYLQIYNHLYGLDYIVFRYPNIYGPRQDPMGEAGVIAIFIGQMLKNEQIYITGDGKQERDFVFIKDIVEASMLATHSDYIGVMNLGSGKGTSVNQLFEILAERINYTKNAKYKPAIPGETKFISLDPTRALNELNWLSETSIKEGMIETVDYFLTNEAP